MIEKLLDRLANVRQTGPDTWMASCPAHEDSTPSLSLREADDRVLVNCFGGCAVADILASVDLGLSDLFPPSQESRRGLRKPFPSGHILRMMAHEALVVEMAAAKMGSGEELSPTDRARLVSAMQRLGEARRYA